MNIRERRDVYYYNLTPETPFCINCKHFIRHYMKHGIPYDCGHCCEPRLKNRRVYDTCEKFEKKENDHDPRWPF